MSEKQRWYTIQVSSQREKKVKKAIEDRVAYEGLQAEFGDILVPTEEVVEMKDGKKRTTERKFFPGYVLIKMAMNDVTWHLVRHIPDVHGFIGGQKPAVISDCEVDRILNRVQDTVAKPTPKVLYEVGEVVRITDGPFIDFNGVVEEVNYDKSRLNIAVSILGRVTPVELSFNQVEKEKI